MRTVGAIAATLAGSLLVAGCGDRAVEVADRQRQVAENGAEVMPFDLEATTHIFKRTDGGLVQVVVADDPADEDQIPLIRTHLQKEARRFNAGDFGDPQAIHGADMPGVQELARGADLLDIRYRSVPAGGKIVFHTASPALVTALHAWASAQVEDHGQHAEHG